jgi:hypothetical protein
MALFSVRHRGSHGHHVGTNLGGSPEWRDILTEFVENPYTDLKQID